MKLTCKKCKRELAAKDFYPPSVCADCEKKRKRSEYARKRKRARLFIG